MEILPFKNKLVYEPFSKLSISHNNVINHAPAKNSYIYKYINKNKGAYEPETMAKAVVEATAHYDDPELVGNVSKGLGKAMSGLEESLLETKMASRGH